MAEKHIDALVTVTGIGRKKCVILDLDGTLWPGVLAETGSPFAWTPEISGAFSYIGLYFGLHEALLSPEEARHRAGLRQQERRSHACASCGNIPSIIRRSVC